MPAESPNSAAEYFSVSRFSEICGVSRQTLIYYDKIGLFQPAHRERNGYRWYTHNQIEIIFLIQTLSAAGLSLKQIESYMQNYSPEKARNVFQESRQSLEKEIAVLQSRLDMICKRMEDLETAEALSDTVTVREFAARPMYVSSPFHFPALSIPACAWVDFYDSFEACHISFGYPVCYIVAREDLENGNWNLISRLGVFLRSAASANYEAAPGLYASACGTGHYGQTDAIYQRLSDFITSHHYTITGPAYEEYLLDEVLQQNQDHFLILITIPVAETDQP